MPVIRINACVSIRPTTEHRIKRHDAIPKSTCMRISTHLPVLKPKMAGTLAHVLRERDSSL